MNDVYINAKIREKLKEEITKLKKSPSDKIRCEICDNLFTRANKSQHNKTQKHLQNKKIYDKIIKTALEKYVS